MSALNPNAPMTRFRRWLAGKITVHPRPGRAWCLDCAMNGGRTLVIDADDAKDHAQAHQDCGDTMVQIDAVWPPREEVR